MSRLAIHSSLRKGAPPPAPTYTYTDTDVTGPRVYYYKLEEVCTSGSHSDYGPVSAAVGDAKAKAFTGSGTIHEADTAEGLGDITLEGTGAAYGHHRERMQRSPPAHRLSPGPQAGGWWMWTSPSDFDKSDPPLLPCGCQRDVVYFWDGKKWQSCSLQAYENNCLRVTITNGAEPGISDMSQLVFTLVSRNSQIPTLTQWGLILLAMLLAAAAGVAMKRREENCRNGN